jgi:hypothetical protein
MFRAAAWRRQDAYAIFAPDSEVARGRSARYDGAFFYLLKNLDVDAAAVVEIKLHDQAQNSTGNNRINSKNQ